MTTCIPQPGQERGDGRLNKYYLKRQCDEYFPFHRVKTDLSSSVGVETIAIGSEAEHQQKVQGRQESSSSFQRARFFRSHLSRCDPELDSGNSKSSKSEMKRRLVWGNRQWWWEASSGTRNNGAFWTVLLFIIGVTFVFSVYLNREGLKGRLSVADGMSSNFCTRSIMASFPAYYENLLLLQQEHEGSEGEQLRLDMTLKVPGC